jgi:hypothetical protein
MRDVVRDSRCTRQHKVLVCLARCDKRVMTYDEVVQVTRDELCNSFDLQNSSVKKSYVSGDLP